MFHYNEYCTYCTTVVQFRRLARTALLEYCTRPVRISTVRSLISSERDLRLLTKLQTSGTCFDSTSLLFVCTQVAFIVFIPIQERRKKSRLRDQKEGMQRDLLDFRINTVHCAMNSPIGSEDSTWLLLQKESSITLAVTKKDGLAYKCPPNEQASRMKMIKSSKRLRSKGSQPSPSQPLSPPLQQSLFHILPIIEEEDSSSRWNSLPKLTSDQLDSLNGDEAKDCTRRQHQVNVTDNRQDLAPLSSERKRSRPTLPRRQKSLECLDIGTEPTIS